MRHLLITFLFFVVTSSFAQIKFEKGYLVDSLGNRHNCYIKNIEWNSNPNTIKYKMDSLGAIITGDVSTISEFEVGRVKYVRAFVSIDRSSDDLNSLRTNDRTPHWSKEVLFLNVVREGKVNLYQYIDGNLNRYFYSNDSSIVQLVYKRYLTEWGSLGYNESYKKQLQYNLSCSDQDKKRIENLLYARKELDEYIRLYNECKTGVKEVDTLRIKRNVFNLKFTPGYTIENLTVFSPGSIYEYQVAQNKGSYRIGLEAEFILGVNKNKWAILFEPAYYNVSATKKISTLETIDFKYEAIELAVGGRYYSFLKNNSRLFFNIFYISNYSSLYDTHIYYLTNRQILTSATLSLGTGFEYGRFSVEARYYLNRDLMVAYTGSSALYSRTAFVLGYRFLKCYKNTKY